MVLMSNELIIIICVAGSVFIILILFITIAICKRRAIKRLICKKLVKSSYISNINEEHEDESMHGFEAASAHISRSDFSQMCAKKHSNNDYIFNEEFINIPDFSSTHSSNSSNDTKNKAKNRYSNIKAYDHSRVVLTDDPDDDYINANFVQGFSCDRKFIATQGPKPDTVVDFWRMVFVYKVKAIVMLTNLIENGVIKCNQYWPEKLNANEMYGLNQITFVEEVKRFMLELIGFSNHNLHDN